MNFSSWIILILEWLGFYWSWLAETTGKHELTKVICLGRAEELAKLGFSVGDVADVALLAK